MTHIHQLLNKVNGNTIMSITTSTNVKLQGGKKNPLQGLVRKITEKTNVMIFTNQQINGYEAMVERRLKAEGKDPASFVLGPRVWGHRLPETPFVEHKGNHYLEVITLRGGKVHYEVDGIPTKRNMIQGLPDEPIAPRQGNLDNKVKIRVYSVESITKMVVDKHEYTNIQY